jgi:hypothetical protein
MGCGGGGGCRYCEMCAVSCRDWPLPHYLLEKCVVGMVSSVLHCYTIGGKDRGIRVEVCLVFGELEAGTKRTLGLVALPAPDLIMFMLIEVNIGHSPRWSVCIVLPLIVLCVHEIQHVPADTCKLKQRQNP